MPHEDVAELLGQHSPPLVLRRELPFPVQDDRAASDRRAGAFGQGALDDGDMNQPLSAEAGDLGFLEGIAENAAAYQP